MREINKECKRLCDIQADLFEKSVIELEMSSDVFARRFMNSKIAHDFDNESFLDDSKTINDIFAELDAQYGKSTYGTVKYNRNSMYWAGYLFRCFAYMYELSSKQVYKYLSLKEVVEVYEPYHTLDIVQAIERLLEAKGISFDANRMNMKGVELLKQIRSTRN